MLRALVHFWRLNLAVAVGAAVAAAVLTGALLVGDSVRGSLRDLALSRLGRVDHALTAPGFVRESLAEAIAASAPGARSLAAVAPVLRREGSATLAGSGRRAAGVAVLGVDGRGLDLLGPAPIETDGVVLNASLAAELGARAGDAVLLAFESAADAPRDTLLGDRRPEKVVRRLRAVVTSVIPDSGAGRFALEPGTSAPFAALLPLADLQRALDRQGEVDTLLVAARPGEDAAAVTRALAEALEEAATPDDLDLNVTAEGGRLAVGSRRFVLSAPQEAAVLEAGRQMGLEPQRVLTYLANRLEVGGRSVPYSTVSAVEPLESLVHLDGTPALPLAEDEILVGAWAAEDLDAVPGDDLTMTYYAFGPREEAVEKGARFRVRGVVRLTGLGGDPSLTPDYPGIEDAEDIAGWDPPFPVDLRAVGERDEAYWDAHKGTPKAFVSMSAARRLWSSRHGATTSVRFALAGEDPEGARQRFAALVGRAGAARILPRFAPVRERALAAAGGSTDFSALFLAFSVFLIAAAALLAALLFTFGVEGRRREIGLLLALGFPPERVRRRFLGEGALLAVAGTIAGVPAGIGYAALLMLGLSTVWRPAIGFSALALHVGRASLAIGGSAALLVVLAAIVIAVRRIARLPPVALLGGGTRQPLQGRGGRASARSGIRVAQVCLTLAGLSLIAGLARPHGASPALAFTTSVLMLVGGLAWFAHRARHGGRGGAGSTPTLVGMAARQTASNPWRATLCVALVALASFVVLVAGASRHEGEIEIENRASGSGGFDLIAAVSIPVPQDLATEEGRAAAGLEPDPLAGAEVFSLRALPGDDASCLSLLRPAQPRLLGVPAELRRRGGFSFAGERDPGAVWARLEQDLGPGVVPALGDAHAVRWILHLGPGQDLEIENERGEPVRLRFVGLLQSSIFQGEVLIAEERFLEHFPGRAGYGAFLIRAGRDQAEATGARLEAGLSRFALDAVTAERRLAAYREVENTYLSTFATLGGLGLLLGTAGLAVALLRHVLERRREIAMLAALGYSSRRLAAMILAENLYLLAVGLTLGAAAAGSALLPVRSGEGVPWVFLASTMAAVVGAGILSSLGGVLVALRGPLLAILKAEP